MKNLLKVLIMFMSVHPLCAQTVTTTIFSSDGGYSSSAQGSIAWTIGEPISETYVSGAHITTMGFHQQEIELATLLQEQSSGQEILVYPNPVKENLQINFKGISAGAYTLVMVDALGKLIFESETSVSENEERFQIRLNEIAAGDYFLSVKGKNFDKTVKINKIN